MAEHKAKRRPFRILGKTLVLSLGVMTTVVVGAAFLTKLPGEETLAGGIKRNTAVYVTMPDGTNIAADIWLPKKMQPGEKMPVLLMVTRYWRATQTGWLQRVAYGLGLSDESFAIDPFMQFMSDRGFVIVKFDARGSGASEGNRRAEWAPEEVGDFGSLARWASAQPWSNGRVGAVGGSYEGNTAELFASTGEPSIKAVAPLYNDFDPLLHNSNPGGAFNTGFVRLWGLGNEALDRNDVCALTDASGIMCLFTKWMVVGVKPVDADSKGLRLKSILEKRKSNSVLNAISGVEYRDDLFKDSGGLSIEDVSPFAKKEQFERYQVPTLIWTSWIDAATSDGTLSRYLTFNTPQEVYIGAYSHGGEDDADPTMPINQPPEPSSSQQWDVVVKFFDSHLRGDKAVKPKRVINYFTMGERTWKRTESWPPARTIRQTLYFGDGASLTDTSGKEGIDDYDVDFSAGTGKSTRWATQMGGDVFYTGRREESEKLLTYTSAPLSKATVVTGTPVVTTYFSTSASDGMIIAYLEDVAPNGQVTYITEGILRLTNRAETLEATPYVALAVNRSFRRRDALPVRAGEVMKVRLPLFATSFKVKAGHRIRVSLAGAANGQFDPIPKTQNVRWTVHRGIGRPSGVELPIER